MHPGAHQYPLDPPRRLHLQIQFLMSKRNWFDDITQQRPTAGSQAILAGKSMIRASSYLIQVIHLTHGKEYPIQYGIGQFIGSDRFFVTRYQKKGYWIAHPIRYPEYRIAAGSIALRYRSNTNPVSVGSF
ncbi:hypothetical protein PGTUg99_031967 [Puccinia graminis f. sp. tritici]|uniref:Uncharacterized protein n=1 Tax=Puccinia graminis f. sp. tritici TaxID=56615 RepID=A0A5B0PJS8_PUCGR|nr:hypothetical protein PGTUg99_031967 [Puccinia graminis f. sp. tritici]